MSVVLTNLHWTGINSPSAAHWGGDLSPTPWRRRRLRISQLRGPKHIHAKLFYSYAWVGTYVGTYVTHVTHGSPLVPQIGH